MDVKLMMMMMMNIILIIDKINIDFSTTGKFQLAKLISR